jgi:hypothetical protein
MRLCDAIMSVWCTVNLILLSMTAGDIVVVLRCHSGV